MRIHGKCHCGNIAYVFDIPGDAKDLPARACTCTFCVKHGGLWTSHREGKLAATVRDESVLSKYRFGTSTADFYICLRCGVVPFVTSDIEERLYAVVNVNTFDGIDLSSLTKAAVNFEGETTDARLARREARWIPNVRIAGVPMATKK
jgi:hypothetical protein